MIEKLHNSVIINYKQKNCLLIRRNKMAKKNTVKSMAKAATKRRQTKTWKKKNK